MKQYQKTNAGTCQPPRTLCGGSRIANGHDRARRTELELYGMIVGRQGARGRLEPQLDGSHHEMCIAIQQRVVGPAFVEIARPALILLIRADHP
jgi:hypothetical protein